jgi:hypothetical protein
MTLALSNPYELTVGGITCKSSPFEQGYYLSNEDIDKLGDKAVAFKKALFEMYEVQQSKELAGIKVFCLKEKPINE